jgi:hypothetical protein
MTFRNLAKLVAPHKAAAPGLIGIGSEKEKFYGQKETFDPTIVSF